MFLLFCRYNCKAIVEGTDLTHMEFSLICVQDMMVKDNVHFIFLILLILQLLVIQIKIKHINYTSLARLARGKQGGSFPHKAPEQIAKLIKNILSK